MSTTTNLGITRLEAGLRQPESVVNDALTTLDAQFILPVSWTPTWTNLTVGDGTVVAKYQKISKLVICRLSLVFGSSTSVTGTTVSFTLPVTRAAYGGSANITPLGNAHLFDTSGSAIFHGIVANLSTTAAVIAAWKVDGTYSQAAALSSTVPFTWAVGDEIGAQFSYEAA